MMDQHPYDVPSTSESQDIWLTSYGDLMTILLVFFILLISASKISSVKFERIKEAFTPPSEKIIDEINLTELAEMLRNKIEEQNLSSLARIVEDDSDVKLILQDRLLFPSGSAQLKPESVPILEQIVSVFKNIPPYTRISIEGHTDDNPIHNIEYPSNWHLSSARALSVLEVFYRLENCNEKCELRGFGKYQPIVPNRDNDGKPIPENQATNRRVVVRIY